MFGNQTFVKYLFGLKGWDGWGSQKWAGAGACKPRNNKFVGYK
jgi:hypothetical protein